MMKTERLPFMRLRQALVLHWPCLLLKISLLSFLLDLSTRKASFDMGILGTRDSVAVCEGLDSYRSLGR